MGKGSFPAVFALLGVLVMAGCASTVTPQFKPKTLADGAPTAQVVMMRGCAKLSHAYCPSPGGQVQTLDLVSDESTWGAVGKVAFMVTPYGWATMAAHSGKEAIITLPAGRVDLEIEHVQRRKTSWEYKDGKVVKEWFRQWTWKQVIPAQLQAGEEYVLELPQADCARVQGQADVEAWLVSHCVARLLQGGQPVAPSGPPLLASVDSTVTVTEESAAVAPATTSTTANQSMIPDQVLRDRRRDTWNTLHGNKKK